MVLADRALLRSGLGRVNRLGGGLFDLVGMHIAFLRQLDQCFLTLDRGHRQLPARYGAMGSALRGRLAAVLLQHVGGHDHGCAARSSCHGLLLAGSIMLRLRGNSTLPTCSVFRRHLS